MFRKGPEDLPINHTLVGITLGIVTLTTYFYSILLLDMFNLFPMASVAEEQGTVSEFFQHLMSMMINFAIIAGVLYLILLTFRKEARTYKTFFALQGTLGIIQCITSIGVAVALILASLNVQIVSLIFGILLFLGGLALGIWAILINCHIFGRALDSGKGKGFLIMIVHMLLVGILSYFVLDFVGIDPVIQIEQPAIES